MAPLPPLFFLPPQNPIQWIAEARGHTIAKTKKPTYTKKSKEVLIDEISANLLQTLKARKPSITDQELYSKLVFLIGEIKFINLKYGEINNE